MRIRLVFGALHDVQRGGKGNRAFGWCDKGNINAARLQGRSIICICVHYVDLALLEQARQGCGRCNCSNLGQGFA